MPSNQHDEIQPGCHDDAPQDDALKLDQPGRDFYRAVLLALKEANLRFLIGGAMALRHYTGIVRDTKDIDLFLHASDLEAAIALFRAKGFHGQIASEHWLAKVACEERFADIIFNSGNGATPVDDEWFTHASDGELLGIQVRFVAPEEIIWSKAYIMERHRFDGGDVAHLLLACGEHLDWPRLLKRFGEHWTVLYAHVALFSFIYPSERLRLPTWVVTELSQRLMHRYAEVPPVEKICNGTFLSSWQYATDVEKWGFADGRAAPQGPLTLTQIAAHTKRLYQEHQDENRKAAPKAKRPAPGIQEESA